MSRKFEIRHTGRPFGPCEPLCDEDFRYVEAAFETLQEARDYIAVNPVRSQNGWWDHHHIFPTVDVKMRSDFRCDGCGRDTTKRYVWRADTRDLFVCSFCDGCQRRIDQMQPGDADFDQFYANRPFGTVPWPADTAVLPTL